ncbi:MAG TPA: DUF3489 domain-containing protein [Sphingobium sp.]|nr:DUF3489 domain-containing protein [Sphingobium sp.]
MTKTVRLTDIQLVLLSTAAQRDNGSLLPPPDTLGDSGGRIRKAVASLIRRHLAEEVELPSGADAWRTEGGHSVGVVITDAGRAAIGLTTQEAPEPALAAGPTPTAADESAAVAAPPAVAELPSGPGAHTKSALVLEMLRRTSGATLDELTSATSWLPHTTRAALTGLRKKGHAIEKRKRGAVTCYHLEGQA